MPERPRLDIILNHTGDSWASPGDAPYYFWTEAPGPFPFGFWREVDPASGFQDDDAVWPAELQHSDCSKRRGQIRNWSDPDEAITGDSLSLKELDINRPPGGSGRTWRGDPQTADGLTIRRGGEERP